MHLGIISLFATVLLSSCNVDCEDVYHGPLDIADSSFLVLPAAGRLAFEMEYDGKVYPLELIEPEGPAYVSVVVSRTGERNLARNLILHDCWAYIDAEQLDYKPGTWNSETPVSFEISLTKNIGFDWDEKPGKARPGSVSDILLIYAGYSNTILTETTAGPETFRHYSERRFTLPLQETEVLAKTHRMLDRDSFIQVHETNVEYFPFYQLNGIRFQDVYKISLSGPQYDDKEKQYIEEGNTLNIVESVFYKKGVGLLAAFTSDGRQAFFTWHSSE